MNLLRQQLLKYSEPTDISEQDITNNIVILKTPVQSEVTGYKWHVNYPNSNTENIFTDSNTVPLSNLTQVNILGR